MKTKRTLPTKRERFLIGHYDLGNLTCAVYGCPGTGGSFNMRPGDTSPPSLHIGLDYQYWTSALSVLIHEAQETLMCANRCRYVRTGESSAHSDAVHFVLNHQEFSVVCDHLAYFLVDCIGDVGKAWRKWKTLKGEQSAEDVNLNS